MKTRLTAMVTALALGATPALAELVFPDLSYRTGPFAAGGIPFSDAYGPPSQAEARTLTMRGGPGEQPRPRSESLCHGSRRPPPRPARR